MSFMEKIETIANKQAIKLANEVPNTKYPTLEDQIEVYTYSISGIYGTLLQILLLILFALIFKTLVPVIFIMLTFSSFRVIGAGGYHFDTFEKCTITSIIQFVTAGLVINYIFPFWYLMNLRCLFIICIFVTLYCIYRYVPRDTPNAPITDNNKRKRFKMRTTICLSVWFIIILLFFYLNLNIIILSSCFGLLLELFSVSKFGYYHIYNNIDKVLSINKSN